MDVNTEIALIKQSQDMMETALQRLEIKIDKFIDKADTRYVMRREFIVAITIVGVIMPIIVFLLSKIR